MELLERKAELDRIRELLDAAAVGHGRLALVEGPAGIGKTELLTAGCSLASERGFAVYRARGFELERELAYGVVRQLLERQNLRREGAARLAEPALWPADATGLPPAAAGSVEVLHGLYWACADLAAGRPLLLAVDDAHWADAPSIRFVQYLARRVHELRLLIMLTCRPHEPGTDPAVFLRLAGEPNTARLTPDALSVAAVAQMVHARLSVQADASFCRACHQASAGNPFLVSELLEEARVAGIVPTAENSSRILNAVPQAVSRSVQLRLAALPADAVGLARATAVLGGNAELRHAAGVARLSVVSAAQAADTLHAAAILSAGRPVDFVHPLVRAAVYSSMSAADRAQAHRRAARLLGEDGAAPERSAVHLLSTEPQDDEWTVEILRRAARAALAQGVPQTAIGYLRRALAEPPPPPVRAEVLHELGAAEQLIGDAAALDRLRQALELATVTTRASIARRLALALLWADRVSEAEQVLDHAVATVADPELAVRLEAEVLSAARLSLSAGLWGAERVERWRGRLHGNTPGERLMLANLATQTALGDFTAAEAADLAEAAAAEGRLLDEQTTDAMPFYQVIYVLTSADRVHLAERLITHAAADARSRGSLSGTILASLFGAFTAFSRGDLAAAEARAGHALELTAQLDAPLFYLPPSLAGVLDVLIERDRLDEAERTLHAHGMTTHLPDTVPFRILLFSRAKLRAAQARWQEAADDLLELGRRQTAWPALNPHLVPHDCAAAIALAALGQREPAAALAHHAVARARRWGTARATGLALQCLALVGDGRTRIELLQQAAAALAASPAQLDHARVLTDLGAALRRAGHRTDASATLRTALDLADRCGGLAIAARARDELRALGLRPRRAALTGVAALTASQRRVAELAAGGSTNRQIAQALFVTERTVETHLTHTYQKLRVQTRTQLQEVLQKPPDESPPIHPLDP